jgi:6-phosphogluconate dehydrogenase
MNYEDFMAEAEKLDPEGFAKARAEHDELERLRSENAELLKALEHQRTALLTVRDRQGGHVSIEDLNKGIKQLDAAIDAGMANHSEPVQNQQP